MDRVGPGPIKDEAQDAGAGRIEIGVSLAPAITFASHQSDVAALTDLVVCNGTDREIEGAVLTVSADPPVLGACPSQAASSTG